MNFRLPVAASVVLLSASLLLYYLYTIGNGNGNSLGLVNSVGLAAVFIGVVAAGFILRRATPQQ